MRTDAIDFDIFGTTLRVICEDPQSLELLRTTLADHTTSEPAPVAFSLQVPNGRQSKLHVLLDRSGLILSRSRSAGDCLECLFEHLGAFLPPPAGTTRFRIRSLLHEEGTAVLVPFPILASPPLVERRLARAGYRMIDRLAVDVSADGNLRMTEAPWSATERVDPPMGHGGAPALADVRWVLSGGPAMTPARVLWLLATCSLADDRHRSLGVAKKLMRTEVISFEPERSLSLYTALEVAPRDFTGG